LGDPQDLTYSGDATGLQDVQGPVAVEGTITTTGFSLNSGQGEPIAVIAGGGLKLTSGTVYGQAYYGNGSANNTFPSVTFTSTSDSFPNSTFDPSPSAQLNQGAINFVDSAIKLQKMSATIKTYTADVTSSSSKYGTNRNGTIALTGSDSELNVFLVESSQLTGAYNFNISVPQGAFVIVNITGTSPTIYGAGIVRSAGLGSNHILWNFPDAKSLTIQSVGWTGSMLAPLAEADLRWGSITGTVVVKKAVPTFIELHWSPFQGMGSRGCLSADASWSCSDDTYVDPSTGYVAFPAPEAGFLQIPGGQYKAEGAKDPRISPNHRIWYSFWPASSSPQNKPIAVFFNGGPGFGTSADLFLFNTGPVTFDPLVTGSSNLYVSNPDTWQQFANLLYIDAPTTGFSYPSDTKSNQMDVGIDMDRDAGIFLSTITKFILRHPALQHNPVILVGESYGGTRATLILNHLLNYSHGTYGGDAYQDSQVLSDLRSYFLTVFSTMAPGNAAVTKIFGHQVLIEPALVGDLQQSVLVSADPIYSNNVAGCISSTSKSGCIGVGLCDQYNCDQVPGWGIGESTIAAGKLMNSLDTLQAALGVAPTTIQWMYKSERNHAHGRVCTNCPSSDFMIGTFKALDSSKDTYMMVQNPALEVPYGNSSPSPAQFWRDTGAGKPIGQSFLSNVFAGITSFITVAEYDGAIYTPSIPTELNNPSMFGVNVTYDPTAANVIGNGRNGLMTVVYLPDAEKMYVAMPHYFSGHSIPQHQAQSLGQGQSQAHQLLQDVMQWYNSTPK
jgi:choice-of-anchor A domain-containing protein